MITINRAIYLILFIFGCLYFIWLSYTLYVEIVFINTKRTTEAIIESRNDEGPEDVINIRFFDMYRNKDIQAFFTIDKQLFEELRSSPTVTVSYGKVLNRNYISNYKEPTVGSIVISFITFLMVLTIDVLLIKKFVKSW